jgi:putative SOS response-associated peptidase YedK
VDTVAILTTVAKDLVGEIHNRMPVIVDPKDYDVWMGRHIHDPWVLGEVMRPFPSDRMEAYPVSDRVNNPRNDDPACVEVVER